MSATAANPESMHSDSAANTTWTSIAGSVSTTLLPELKKMYWGGVKRELCHILLTMRKWKQPQYCNKMLPGERDGFIYGFDTFVDQVIESSREFAERYENRAKRWQGWQDDSYEDAIVQLGMNFKAERDSAAIKMKIRDSLAGRKRYNIAQRRARMLLQSAGFLDIDKLIEYRPPEEMLNSWRRPVAPQLSFVKSEDSYVPTFIPLQCSECQHTIRGSMFKNSDENSTVCESCYRDHHYGDEAFLKLFKHCVLQDCIGKFESQAICHCSNVAHIDKTDGSRRMLFPVDPLDDHRGSDKMHKGIKCGLLNLRRPVAEAKYEGMLLEHENHVTLTDQKRIKDEIEDTKKKEKERIAKIQEMKDGTWKDLVSACERIKARGRSPVLNQNEVHGDIPFFLPKVAQKYPFADVHMTLRVGPLIIENGVENLRGALITNRDPPNLQVLRDSGKDIEYSLLLNGDAERMLHSQYRTDRKPKRYSAVLKQVVGGVFSGLSNIALEEEIVETMLRESRRRFDMSPSDEETLLERSTNRLVTLLKRLIGSRIEIYLNSIISKLLDPSTYLVWDALINNCMKFCDSLLDRDTFGSLLAPSSPLTTSDTPLYLMSFLTQPGTFPREPRVIKTKHDVPAGHIEEYMHEFWYGQPAESDIIDTIQEYWHDWGAFSGGHIYKQKHTHHELFPWDCTEAFKRSPGTCDDCKIGKHVWAFPFDSWSIVALHLARGRCLYPPTEKESDVHAKAESRREPEPLSDGEWMENRLTVLLAQDALLTVAVAMVSVPSFHKATAWLNKKRGQNEDEKVYYRDMDRLRLGGIHRSQPPSHSLKKGEKEYHGYFIAEWAHLKKQKQIKLYESLRNMRANMDDAEGVSTGSFKEDDMEWLYDPFTVGERGYKTSCCDVPL